MVNRFVLVGTEEGEVGIGEASEFLVKEFEADQLEKGRSQARSSGFLAATDLTAVDGQGI